MNLMFAEIFDEFMFTLALPLSIPLRGNIPGKFDCRHLEGPIPTEWRRHPVQLQHRLIGMKCRQAVIWRLAGVSFFRRLDLGIIHR